MPFGIVRRTFFSISAITLGALGAACSSGSVSEPGDGKPLASADGKATGPSGFEQRISIKVGAAPAGSPYTALLTATSTVVNTGSASAPLTSRVCFVQEADVETSARLDRFEPLISCAADSMTSTLAPGQSVGPLEVQFGVRSPAGTYTLKLRHALSPEFRAEVTFRVP